MYEYFDKVERRKLEEDEVKAEDDKIEQEKWDEAEAWAEEEERKELERLKEQEEKASSVEQQPTEQTEGEESYDPDMDEEAKAWMEKYIDEAKEQFGDDFGGDLSLNMDEDS
jgi:UDP-galactopyranose mutase